MKTFDQLDLIPAIQRALADQQYETPTPIQALTVPAALQGRDVLGCAQTGTGKTAAFALPTLSRIGRQNRKAKANRPFALVLAPTRELAIQIEQSFATYGKYLRIRQALVYGGVGQGSQVRALNRGAHILVATPGRLLDLMDQGFIHLDLLEAFVLDEADRMLDMGFMPDLKRIVSQLPPQRQSLFFSATLPPKIVELSRSLLTNPVNVNVTPKSTSLEKIQQQVLFVERKAKQTLLRKILDDQQVQRTIVFTKTKRTASALADRLSQNEIKAVAIHGDKSQNARQRALNAFRRDRVQVLVATDVAARGIDIDGITHVINFDLPVEPEAYVHRIGRTGRAGTKGIAFSFCASDEQQGLRAIEQFIGQKLSVSPDHPRPTSRQNKPARPSRGKGRPSPRGADVKGSRTKKSGTKSRSAGYSTGAAQSDSKPKRPRRQGAHSWKRNKQTN